MRLNKPRKTYKQLLIEEELTFSENDSDLEEIDIASFEKIDETLQKEVIKIVARLKKSQQSRKAQRNRIRAKLDEIKQLHQDCSDFKNEALVQIEKGNSDFRIFKQDEMSKFRDTKFDRKNNQEVDNLALK